MTGEALPPGMAVTAAAYTSFKPNASPTTNLVGRAGLAATQQAPGNTTWTFRAPAGSFYLVFTSLNDSAAGERGEGCGADRWPRIHLRCGSTRPAATLS